MRLVVSVFGIITLLSLSCQDLEEALKKWDTFTSEETAFTELPGSEASQFFDVGLKDITTDIAAVLGAINVDITGKGQANLVAQGLLSLAETEQPQEVSEGSATILTKNEKAKKDHKPEDFQKITDSIISPSNAESSFLTAANDTVNWGSQPNEYTIPVLEKMPIRNQGQRGTCASFAGIGQLEGYILANTTLQSIDLSEQRFYAMSKPDHWSNGGDPNAGGSNSGSGFKTSYYKTTTYGNQTSPDTYGVTNSYNIPLESQCPYVDTPASTDIHYPETKEGSCTSGVAQVTDFAAWMYQWTDKINTAQQIFDHIWNKKYPVIVSSYLTGNWEKNDGIITYADAKAEGDTSHAGGHAYLVVGFKKLNETEYPGEGGMCFIIKNSWGKGWGINGLSCMTLTWFNNYRKGGEYGFPWIKTASIDTAALETEKTKTQKEPDKGNIEEPDPGTITITEEDIRPKGKVTFAMKPGSGIHLTASDFTLGFLLNNEDEIRKVLYKVDGDKFYLRGLLNDATKQTHTLEMKLSGTKLRKEFNGQGEIDVGSFDDKEKLIKLCSQEYHVTCHFNYLSESNELLLGLSKEQINSDETEGPYDWTYIGAGGQGIEFSRPETFSTKVDLRFSKDGVTTNPLRFRLNSSAKVLFHGTEVGDLKNGICKNDYASVCRMVRTSTEFYIIFKS